jgi:hypothetical protein
MGLIVIGVPVLGLLMPLYLVIRFRHTRGWWLPGVATSAVGMAMLTIISATAKPSHGDLPLISEVALVCLLGYVLAIWGGICLVIGRLASGAGRRARWSAEQSADDLPQAYLVDRPRD